MIYVTSDLHGCSVDVFKDLLQRSGFTDRDFLFILGDVIDRGTCGAELLLWLTEQPNMQLILGNHEAMLLACGFLFEEVTDESLESLSVERLHTLENWLQNGGGPTLSGLRKILRQDKTLLDGIFDYLRESPIWESITVAGKHYILVHSGLGNFHPRKPLDAYTPEELLWERPALGTSYFQDAIVIFGHTPTEFYGACYRGKAVTTSSWICIDTGTALGHSPMLLRLEDKKEFY